MNLNADLPYGSTPLEDHEIDDLVPSTISTRGELDEWEQTNILEAEGFVFGRRRKPGQILTIDFLKNLHVKMFGNVWKWAGTFRKTDKNIGVSWHNISGETKLLLDDVTYQIGHKSYSPDEIAIRFHHRLVKIHAFPNGNGRHSRLAADGLIVALSGKRFPWGNTPLSRPTVLRRQYINALIEADREFNYKPLLKFARQGSASSAFFTL